MCKVIFWNPASAVLCDETHDGSPRLDQVERVDLLVIITSYNRGYLEAITAKVVERLAHADWQISAEKSVLRPVERIEYLGVYVSSEGIAQTPKIARMKSGILDLLETPLLLST